jgi:hypothetical protein
VLVYRSFWKPISLAFSLKQRRHIMMPYLRMRAWVLPHRLREIGTSQGEKRSANRVQTQSPIHNLETKTTHRHDREPCPKFLGFAFHVLDMARSPFFFFFFFLFAPLFPFSSSLFSVFVFFSFCLSSPKVDRSPETYAAYVKREEEKIVPSDLTLLSFEVDLPRICVGEILQNFFQSQRYFAERMGKGRAKQRKFKRKIPSCVPSWVFPCGCSPP